MRLTADELRKRYAFDFRVIRELDGPVLTVRAFRSTADLESDRYAITSIENGHQATRYRIDYHVRTLIARGRWQETTSIGFDLSVDDYPTHEPANWIMSDNAPFSPHFRRGSPVCTGELWSAARGHVLFAHLVLHVARLLNWDEVARGGGYSGWNEDAIRYHRDHFAGRPLNSSLRLPTLPVHVTHGEPSDDHLFQGTRAPHAAADENLFGLADSDHKMFSRTKRLGSS
jgi:hypothetical protein